MSLEKIGRYELVGELGRGAMGVVYKATDPNIGRPVALKTMRLDVHGLESADLMRRFKNEARAAGLLNHPNIVTIYDAGELDGIFYIAMEYLEGTTLQELLAQRRVLEPAEAIKFAREICKGLDYAHSHGIVHRDVKPANIMITRSGAVKIMDFGIAKAGGSMTGTSQVLGTPNYMAPEQVKGKSLDGRSDLFSLGVILYEMLVGEKPFDGQNVTTVIYKIVNENPIPPRELDASIPASLSELVLKALAKAPDDRFQSGADLVRQLESVKPINTVRPAAQASAFSSSIVEKTVALPVQAPLSATVRIPSATASSAKTAVPASPQPAIARGRSRATVLGTLIMVLMLGSLAAAFAYYRARFKAPLLKTATVTQMPTPQAVLIPSPAPVNSPTSEATPTPTPTPDNTPAESADNSQESPVPEKPWVKKKKPAVPAVSELTIASQPAGASVSIDGRSQAGWITPFRATGLKPGNHQLVFSKDGYAQETRTIESLAAKAVSFSVDLTAVFKATISSNPSGATILIDGDDSGMVTPAQLTLEKRQHHITVHKPGYRDASIETSQAVSFSPILLSSNQNSEPGPSTNFLRRFVGSDAIPEGKGLVHIRTVPDGATIVVDGRVAPKKSNARWPADPGIYSIELRLPGYKPVHRNIRVEQGKIAPIDEILERQ